jgi:Helix-turn-helix domain
MAVKSKRASAVSQKVGVGHAQRGKFVAVPDRLMTVDEICAFAQVARSTVYRYLSQGLRSYQRENHGARRLRIDDLLQFLGRHNKNKSNSKIVS